jgi:hypothetical protein
MSAAMNMETTRAEPAKPAAMPVTTKIPPPIIAPTLTATASNKPKEGFNLPSSLSSIAIIISIEECVLKTFAIKL